jgi:HlyD family secretion protein
MKRILWSVLSVALLGAMGYSIVGLVTRGSPTVPRPLDRTLAERVLVLPAPESDLRDPLADLGATNASTLSERVGGNGVIEPHAEEVLVAGEVAGRIATVHVKEGDRVAAGQVLLSLEHTTEEAAVRVAQAEIEAARARLDKVKSGSRNEEVSEAVAQAREATSRAALAQGVFERTDKLYRTAAATEDELDRAKKEAEAARFAAKAAESRRAAIVKGSRAEDVVIAEADVTVAEARLAEAQARLAVREIKAPAAGEVLQVKVRAGEYLQPGGVAVTLGDTSQLMVRVDVDERDYARVELGSPVEIRAKAFGDKVFAGKVVSLGRRMGRKNVRTDDPTERNDTKILEVLVELDPLDSAGGAAGLIVGQRVTAVLKVRPQATTAQHP